MESTTITAPRDGAAAAEQAMDDLRYIRAAMEGATQFTSVPGVWLAVVGGMALGTVAWLRSSGTVEAGSPRWVTAWVVAAVLSLATGTLAMRRKSAGRGSGRTSRPGRKLLLGMGAPLAAGLLVSIGAWRVGAVAMLPGIWLSAYGAGVIAAGAYSPRAVLALGACCLALGGVAFFLPLSWADAVLGLGFGGLHLGFGLFIARRHGG